MVDEDTRYVYGAGCTWHGPIYDAVTSPKTGLPSCPQCGGLLLEVGSKVEWDAACEKFAAQEREPLYSQWVDSLRVKCRALRGWDWREDLAKWKRENKPPQGF